MVDYNKTVNKNDNGSWRKDLYKNAAFIKNIPAATYLIKNFVNEEWKNHPNSYQYTYIEFWLCVYLSSEVFDRNTKIHFAATILECPPIILFNDPNFPVY